jgi:hypothetical protein
VYEAVSAKTRRTAKPGGARPRAVLFEGPPGEAYLSLHAWPALLLLSLTFSPPTIADTRSLARLISGCGKTSIARVLAGRASLPLVYVPLEVGPRGGPGCSGGPVGRPGAVWPPLGAPSPSSLCVSANMQQQHTPTGHQQQVVRRVRTKLLKGGASGQLRVQWGAVWERSGRLQSLRVCVCQCLEHQSPCVLVSTRHSTTRTQHTATDLQGV